MAILSYVFIIILPIVLVTFGLRWWIQKEAYKEKHDRDKPRNKAVAYIYNYSGQLKAVGFVLAIAFCIAMWNFRYEFNVVIEAEKEEELLMDLFDMSINTEQKKPPKPKPILTPKIVEAKKEEIEEEKEPVFDEEPPKEVNPLQGLEGGDDGEDETVVFEDNTIFSSAELQQTADFPGLGGYLQRNFVTPAYDRKRGTKGVIWVYFVIEKDGSITDVSIKRGLTTTADAAVVRVFANMPKWDPGVRSGIPVRSSYVMPFRLK